MAIVTRYCVFLWRQRADDPDARPTRM